ncbi:WD40/YVTN repeat-like-containing domain [Lasallia pustulata]|uniref:WD40/YVTN repeat-like-containing domain n=1 Tax=Lasallia pustulata TaxID=136370 RepID=A0A1W5CVA8_9LECA|nr:WD40/YVTN repeat-like-containing domain [Lasallia pustulata]
MASSHPPDEAPEASEDEEAMLDPNEAAEEIPSDSDQYMESDPEDLQEEEIQLQNDSIAHFDKHTDSVFCIAQHPLNSSIVATGAGDDTTYIFSTSPPSTPLPTSYESHPSPSRASLEPLVKLTGHTDSINALVYTLPNGDYLLSAGLDGRLRTYSTTNNYSFLAEAQEVEEINWLAPNPHPSHPNTIALGASNGSVWVYTISPPTDPTCPGLQVLQAYYLHTASCTAGAWTPDGTLLCTVSEDSSFYAYDVFGSAAAAGITSASRSSQAIVGLTAEDQRFAVEGGLYSVAVAPTGAFAAAGGAGGMIRVVGLPRLGAGGAPTNGSPASAAQRQRRGGGPWRPQAARAV